MEQSYPNKNFTAQDIERYHKGTMPAGERHALEKAALDDPFLADALEGYLFTQTPAADLEKIRERLARKNERRRTVPIWKAPLFRAAAVLVILLGTGWLAYVAITPRDETVAIQESPLKKDNDSNPGFQKDGAQEQSPVQPVSPVTDSIESNSRSAAVEPKRVPLRKNASPAPVQTDITTRIKINDQAYWMETLPADTVSFKNRPIVASVPNIRNEDLTRVDMNNGALNNRNANVQNRNAVPDPNASNIYRRQQNATENEVKKFNDKDASIAQMKTKESGKTDTIRNFDVILKPTTVDAADVVVLSKGTDKSVRVPRVVIDTLEPAEGYARFDDYVASNIKTPDELKTKSMSGEVQLSFEVNREGKPVNITVVKSLCEQCDEEAIRLLKDGPKWKKKKNRKGRITIQF